MGLVPLLNEQEREALARHPAEGVRLALAEQGFPVPEILLQDPSPRVRLAAMRHLNPLAYALLTRPEMRRCLEAWAEQAESLAPRFPSPWPLEFSWETLPWSPEGAQALVLLSRWAKLPGLEGWARQALYDLKGALLRRWLQEGRVEPVALLRGEDPRKRVDEGWVSGLAAPLAVDYLEDALAALLEDPEGEGRAILEPIAPENDRMLRYLSRWRRPAEIVPDLMLSVDRAVLALTTVDRWARARRFAEVIEEEFRGRVRVWRTEYPQRDMALLDFVSPECSKARALDHLARRWGIAPSEIMVVGDNRNDAEMLAYAGLGVVMGNAEEELKALGDYVTGTNDEDGLAQALRRFVLGEAPS
jgi:CheY-like chemotaxis protein